jgi:hypothetical protein
MSIYEDIKKQLDKAHDEYEIVKEMVKKKLARLDALRRGREREEFKGEKAELEGEQKELKDKEKRWIDQVVKLQNALVSTYTGNDLVTN